MNDYYEDKLKEYMKSHFTDEMCKKCIVAINTLRDNNPNVTWRWLYTAVSSKPVNEWEEYGFGLILTSKYYAYVQKKMSFEDAAKQVNLKEWFG